MRAELRHQFWAFSEEGRKGREELEAAPSRDAARLAAGDMGQGHTVQRWAKDRVPVGTAESSALSSSQSQGSSQPLTHRHPTAPLCPECPGGGSPVGRAALCLTWSPRGRWGWLCRVGTCSAGDGRDQPCNYGSTAPRAGRVVTALSSHPLPLLALQHRLPHPPWKTQLGCSPSTELDEVR